MTLHRKKEWDLETGELCNEMEKEKISATPGLLA